MDTGEFYRNLRYLVTNKASPGRIQAYRKARQINTLTQG
jgi:hypothetical protein